MIASSTSTLVALAPVREIPPLVRVLATAEAEPAPAVETPPRVEMPGKRAEDSRRASVRIFLALGVKAMLEEGSI